MFGAGRDYWVQSEWNDKEQSHHHKAIPLISDEFVTQFPWWRSYLLD